MKRPHVLFLICDDLNMAISRHGRAPFAPTPNLERLMDRGVTFTNAANNCPLCLPARNSLFSGLYPHTTGHYTLWDHWPTVTPIATTANHKHPGFGKPLLGQSTFFPRHFKDHGYQTLGAGKVLHTGAQDPDWWDEFDRGADYGPVIFDRFKTDQQLEMYGAEALQHYLRKYRGLDRFFVRETRPNFEIESCFGPLGEYLRSRVAQPVLDGNAPYHYTSDEERDPLPDELTAEYGVRKLGETHDTPFLLALGFMKPHTPLNVPQEYFDRIDMDQLPLPPLLAGDLDDCATAHKEHDPYGFVRYQMLTHRSNAPWKKLIHSYLACVAFLDDQIGKVLDALDNSPYRDETMIIFTSDNGYHLGEKEFVFKDTLWEESGRIPLIISHPEGAQGKVCDHPTSHIDLYPTLADLCDLPSDPHAATHGLPLEGYSLRPFLRDPEQGKWEGPEASLTSVRGRSGTHHSIRTQSHRYILCGNGEEELYDHRVDPYEWHNLANDPKVDPLKEELRSLLLTMIRQEPIPG